MLVEHGAGRALLSPCQSVISGMIPDINVMKANAHPIPMTS
jgi:hypothetical protein